MLLSHRYQFIFIHIYKTAGTSITDELIKYSRLTDRLVYEYKYSKIIIKKIIKIMNWHGMGEKQFTGFHKHAKAYEIKNKLNPILFDNYFKFAFVRNPFDHLVSLYFYISQAVNHRDHIVVKNLSFSQFIQWHINQSPPLQVDFLIDLEKKEKLVDYIGRFETIMVDILSIQNRIGLTNIEIKHKNPSFKRDSADYKIYYDKNSIGLVEKYYETDLHLLGYDFYGFENRIPLMG